MEIGVRSPPASGTRLEGPSLRSRPIGLVHLGAIVLLIAQLCAVPEGLSAQASTDSTVLQSIRREATENSAVIETAFFLTDVFGPRPIGSPALREAGEWASQRLRSYGVPRVWSEALPLPISFGRSGWPGTGWSVERFTVQQLLPHHATLIGEPLLYSTATRGPVRGDVRFLQLPDPNDSAFDEFFSRHRGRLRATALLISPPATPVRQAPGLPDLDRRTIRRYTQQELDSLVRPPAPSPSSGAGQGAGPRRLRATPLTPEQYRSAQARLYRFLRDEGVVALIRRARGSGGTVNAADFLIDPGHPEIEASPPPPAVALLPEHYNRLLRLAERGIRAQVELELAVGTHPGAGIFNVLGELPGSSRPEEVVMIGAHLDSFQYGTGATDNAAGCAVMIEAVRILRVLGMDLDRTVRIALWGGEEWGMRGSQAYVATHFGARGENRPEHARLSGYFNIDLGAGQIRGIYAPPIDSLAPMLRQWLAPFADWGATTVVPRHYGGSDQVPFNIAGLPGIAFIQDPLSYFDVTHHTNMDVLEYVLPFEDDLQRSAAIVAWLVYRAANAPRLLPRESPTSPSR